jgi:hypothetical protein
MQDLLDLGSLLPTGYTAPVVGGVILAPGDCAAYGGTTGGKLCSYGNTTKGGQCNLGNNTRKN